MRFWSAFLTLLALFAAQPVAAASTPKLLSLEQHLNTMLANTRADVGVAALDLSTGETVSVRGNVPFPMASTVKVAVAALYLAQVDHWPAAAAQSLGRLAAAALAVL
jgi:beta-lactamase class A